jgi:uncharacterized metal-binding protein
LKCALCVNKKCYNEGKVCTETKDAALDQYQGEKKQALCVSSRLEALYYMKLTRIEEVIQYASEMNYQKIGIAFCTGLSKEAKIIHKIFEKKFEVVSVCCKNGSISKDLFQLPKVKEGREEAICNPIGQALELNRAKTDLNLIIGLCVGHDILFTQHSAAPVTTLIVKDRVLAHNPAGAIYSNYYLKKKFNIDIDE